MGGVRMANALGHRINVYHMNEGHAGLLTLALIESELGGGPLGAPTEADLALVRQKCVFTTHTPVPAGRSEGHAGLLTLALIESELGGGPLGAPTEADLALVRQKCVFTTHTPVPAGHDRFSIEQTNRILGSDRTARLERLGCYRDGMLNMTLLALKFSRYANGVAMQHAKVTRAMFPEFAIDSITNGVHAPTWICEPIQQILDANISSWRRDNLYLRNAIDLPEKEILSARSEERR